MAEKKQSLLWTLGLYAAAALFGFLSISGAISTKGYLPGLLVIPLLAVLLPPVRNWMDPNERYIPSPKWSLGVAFGILMVQAMLYGDYAKEADERKAALEKAQAVARAEASKQARLDEYAKDKVQILGQIDALLSANKPQEALSLANKYYAVNKDPDLARLQSRADLAVIRLDLQNEEALTLERREQIYKKLIAEEPGGLAKYQDKLKEVTAALEKERRLRAEAAQAAALQERIKSQFSGWDGSHRKVEAAIKSRMHNPDSYKHVETRYAVEGNTISIVTRYRGTNGFGATVTNSAVATVDMDGNVLSLSSL